MVGNLLRRYLGAAIFIVCIFMIMRELIINSQPKCLDSLQLEITLETAMESSSATLEDVIIKARSTSQPKKDSVNDKQFIYDKVKTTSYNNSFTKHRLKLWYGGRCVDNLNDELAVNHCNPDWDQSFTLSPEGTLTFDESGTCVVLNEAKPYVLSLGSCYEAVIFTLTNNSFLHTTIDDEMLCLSPVTQVDVSAVSKYACLDAPIALASCDEEASKLEIVAETDFQVDRSLFKAAEAPQSEKCDFKACNFNRPTDPVEFYTPLFSTRCESIYECVTVVTKTARRPYLVMRLAQSIRDTKGYDMKIVSYDDGPNDYPQEVWDELKKFPELQYNIGEDDDMGISLGRNLALKLVKTKYFLLVDDDHVFNAKTNLTKMMEILDTTDATLVGGKFEGFMKFAGALKFGIYHSRQEFAIFSGHCERELPKFPNCEQCDSTSNIFMAKTEPVLEIGGWSEELKIAEHADFFVKMKATGNKVVYCDDIEVINQQESPEERSKSYQKLRYDMGRKNRMFRLMNSRYNVNGLFWCSQFEVEADGELKCLETKHKIGYC